MLGDNLQAVFAELPRIGPFQPYSRYSRLDGGSMITYWKGDPDHEEKVSDSIYLYRSLETNEVVGCRIVL